MLFKKSLQDELLKFIKKDRVRAHMPGHNGGAGLSSGFKRNAFKLDVTEFDETDNLQNPNGNPSILKGLEYMELCLQSRLWTRSEIIPTL